MERREKKIIKGNEHVRKIPSRTIRTSVKKFPLTVVCARILRLPSFSLSLSLRLLFFGTSSPVDVAKIDQVQLRARYIPALCFSRWFSDPLQSSRAFSPSKSYREKFFCPVSGIFGIVEKKNFFFCAFSE